MAGTEPRLRAEQWLSRLRALPPATALGGDERAACLACAGDLLGADQPDIAVDLLTALTRASPDLAAAWRLLGFAEREEQRMHAAAAAFARAVELEPEDPLSALGRAETAYARGLPAADLFARARGLAPEDLRVLRGAALAEAAEGRQARAEELIEAALARQPGWLEGHKTLAGMRWARGETEDYAASYAQATRAQPQNRGLWLAWFGVLAQVRDWPAARAVLGAAEQALGPEQALLLARLFVASESGETLEAERLFAATAMLQDPVRELAFVRHCLRAGRLKAAEATAVRLLETPAATTAWPYLSLIWRLGGDARAQWLDGAPPYVRAFDLDFSAIELEELAALLRGLHTARAPYLEQSVRGGTQTDGQLFFRNEAIVETARERFEAAIQEYLARLPVAQPGHPLLAGTRGRPIRYGGSWSVRLQAQGYHVSHTHPKGWISSAFYVSLPPPAALGRPPSGYLSFGTPPPELGLRLAPYLEIEPKPGRLVLFPATMWHRTVPFASGERLVLAFDVRAPR